MINIDGSYGEGGGAIIRNAITLSAVTGKSCKINNIRANRSVPGLRPQHLKGVEAMAKLCNAKVTGLTVGSTKIEFIPKKIESRTLIIDIGTAGSITLVLQTLIPACLHADSPIELEITGGTDVKWAPTMAYFETVFCGNLKNMGIIIKSSILCNGFYPKGGGKVRVKIHPCKEIKQIDWSERGNIQRIDCWSFASDSLKNKDVAERQMKGFKKIFDVNNKDVKYVSTLSIGTSITAHAHCNTILGACVLGDIKKKAEHVGHECAKLLKKQIGTKAA
ncbi:RNA 3'-terminal phosphate cyclase, partial [Candidatus Aenigmatarchaeota archaeon]